MCQDPWQLNYSGGEQRNQFIGMVAMPSAPMPTQPPMPEVTMTTMQPGCFTVAFGRAYPFIDDNIKAFGMSLPILEIVVDYHPNRKEITTSAVEDLFLECADPSEFLQSDADEFADAEEDDADDFADAEEEEDSNRSGDHASPIGLSGRPALDHGFTEYMAGVPGGRAWEEEKEERHGWRSG